MALTRLPTELLDTIIAHTLPEGFESLALTCRKTYTLCVPFIQRHNTLHSRFDQFTYHAVWADPSPHIVTAVELIERIAVEPIVARYIRRADFSHDSPRSYIRARRFAPGGDRRREAVLRLLATSPYLEQAGLDWKQYLDKIDDDLDDGGRPQYSQHAAAFLLTLLPNVKTLVLPQRWKALELSDRLIDAVINRAKKSHFLCDGSSLAQVTRFRPYVSLGPEDRFDLSLASPFLALPRVQSFHGPSCVAMTDGHKPIRHCDFGETLEAVSLMASCLDEAGIAEFLRNTKRLKTLRYSHSSKHADDPQCWDICRFVTAIKRQVGSHLVKLSITIWGPLGSFAPGKVSMRDFPRLRQLEFPLDLVMCNIAAAACRASTLSEARVGGSSDHELDSDCLLIGDLVPASVSVLSLISNESDYHFKALRVMFHNFAARKERKLPALRDIYLLCPDYAEDALKRRCTRLRAETEKAGVDLHLEPWAHSDSLTWEG